jgi:hypothetical protein
MFFSVILSNLSPPARLRLVSVLQPPQAGGKPPVRSHGGGRPQVRTEQKATAETETLENPPMLALRQCPPEPMRRRDPVVLFPPERIIFFQSGSFTGADLLPERIMDY